MNYSIETGKHSAEKDHTLMTGGTLTIDKKIHSPEGICFYTYAIPFYDGIFDEKFYKAIHTAEHLLAYKQDTGSVRNSLEEVTQGRIEGKVILDISPYQTSENTFGFRITSMVELNIDEVQKLIHLSLSRAIDFLEDDIPENIDDYMGIPFARAISCGQFNYHDKKAAVDVLQYASQREFNIVKKEFSTLHTSAYVCDLRFLKPRVKEGDGLIMFSPEFSYFISALIEKLLPTKLPGSICIVGTFGCMTGMYLCVSSTSGDETDIHMIHSLIIEILKENINPSELDKNHLEQYQKLMENYGNFGEK